MIDILASALALPVLAMALYLALLAVMARPRHSPGSVPQRLRFEVVIPAHNEELGIARTVRSVLALDYPRDLLRVVVIADNCDDRTTEFAASAGAEVLIRDVPDVRGKGHALTYGFEHSLHRAFADAVVVIDADTVVSANLLNAFSARFEAGAEALQAHYGVRNPESSWRTRLMHLAFTAFHTVRSLARERLGVSCGLRGNGMAFTTAVLRRVPHRAFSIVEDLEYGIALGLAGIRVHYVPEATALGDMCDGEKQSRPQRDRWEKGRARVAKAYVQSLLIEGFRRRDPVLLDLAMDLLVPPLGQVGVVAAAGTAACVGALALGWTLQIAPWLWAGSLAGLAIYAGRSVILSKTGIRGALDLLWVPIYLGWKLVLPLTTRRAPTGEWVRTPRDERR
ncbi:MAG: glycosyltransferase family 2 protein [Acidobacteriota bacterium]